MNNVNKTLYIPLFGKALVSRKGILLHDAMAEKIWDAEGFTLKGKSRSKWLAYYMGMRCAVFDRWLAAQMDSDPGAVILHLGCGMDSRVLRLGTREQLWFDVDFPEVIKERRRYYPESDWYHMIASDIRQPEFLQSVPKNSRAIVVMEGVSMYLSPGELRSVLRTLTDHFCQTRILMDCYTTFAAKASKYKNPIHDVGVTLVYGTDDPKSLEKETGLAFAAEHDMTPDSLVSQLQGAERAIFRHVFAGRLSKKLYRLYEYTT